MSLTSSLGAGRSRTRSKAPAAPLRVPDVVNGGGTPAERPDAEIAVPATDIEDRPAFRRVLASMLCCDFNPGITRREDAPDAVLPLRLRALFPAGRPGGAKWTPRGLGREP